MYFPSFVQLAADLISSEWRRSFSSPAPLADFWYRSNGPLRSEPKTIVAPSGDQIARVLFPAPRVNRELTPRARSRIQMSTLVVRESVMLKARRSPVGESVGFA